jgi:hypothetical protein
MNEWAFVGIAVMGSTVGVCLAILAMSIPSITQPLNLAALFVSLFGTFLGGVFSARL